MKISILLGFLFLPFFLKAQTDYFISGKSIQELRQKKHKILDIQPLPLRSSGTLGKKNIFTNSKAVKPPEFLNRYDVEDLAFFCKIEVKLEKKLQMPFKFRLGEVQYTEKMEGKY